MFAGSQKTSSDGRLCQIFAAATGNARLPVVESRVSGTASAEVDDERRRCRPGSPVTGCKASAR